MFKKIKAWKFRERRPVRLLMPISFSRKRSRNCLSQFRSGDQDAYACLYKRFYKPILRFVRSKVSNEETALEIAQEIFVKVYRFRESYEEGYAFSTWLWTIARNTVTDHLRGTMSRVALDSEGESPDEIPSPWEDAESALSNRDQRRGFMRLLRPLTRMQRRVLWLRAFHQLSYPEIANRLGLSLAAVKNLSYRAKLSLQAESQTETG